MKKIFYRFSFSLFVLFLTTEGVFGQHSVVFPQPQYFVPNAQTFEHGSKLILPESPEIDVRN
jgi:hypothetical protein